MNYFNGIKKKKYFEGWYFRHQNGAGGISFIPSVAVDSDGNKSCFIQALTNEKSYLFHFDFEQFFAEKDNLKIVIGDNIFTKNGCKIKLQNEEVSIKATLKYGEFTPIQGDIMGIFAKVPLMQCQHGVVSMRHSVDGEVTIDGVSKLIANGVGYIEKDSGSSFPTSYLWIQANDFAEDISLFLSIATIPFALTKFKGHICILNYQGEEIRFATYNGSKIKRSFIYDKDKKKEIKLEKDNWQLQLNFVEKEGVILSAPSFGKMDKTTKESLNATVYLKLWKDGELVLDTFSSNSGLEYRV